MDNITHSVVGLALGELDERSVLGALLAWVDGGAFAGRQQRHRRALRTTRQQQFFDAAVR